MTERQFTPEETYAYSLQALLQAGASDRHAKAVAKTITSAEIDGSASHGVFRLPGYMRMLKDGRVKGAANPTIEQIAPSVLRIDSDNAFVPLALEIGHPALIELTRKTGIAALAITKTHHFSALWADTEPLAKAGLAALACTAYVPVVAPYGSKKPFFGTNPISFAWPRSEGAPVVFDMATAAMARGEIQIAARDGHQIPEGTGIDAHGQPTTDPSAILDGGAQLPFGGYKGSAIALMVEMLCAGLIGEAFSDEAGQEVAADGGPPQAGELIIAFDPDHFGNKGAWQAHADAYLRRFEDLPGNPSLPGSRRSTRRAKIAQEGIRIPQSLINEIEQIRNS